VPAGSLSAPDPVLQGLTPALRRIAICLQYDGAAFHGWQRQTSLSSVQEINFKDSIDQLTAFFTIATMGFTYR
jgi:hypothetical protein